MIERRADDGLFDQDVSRLRYLTTCARAQAIAAHEADADYVKVKTELLQTRLMEKRRELVLQSDVDELTDQLCGVVLTPPSGMAARCAPRGDLATGATSSASCSGAHRDGQGLPGDGRQVRRAAAR